MKVKYLKEFLDSLDPEDHVVYIAMYSAEDIINRFPEYNLTNEQIEKILETIDDKDYDDDFLWYEICDEIERVQGENDETE